MDDRTKRYLVTAAVEISHRLTRGQLSAIRAWLRDNTELPPDLFALLDGTARSGAAEGRRGYGFARN